MDIKIAGMKRGGSGNFYFECRCDALLFVGESNPRTAEYRADKAGWKWDIELSDYSSGGYECVSCARKRKKELSRKNCGRETTVPRNRP
jgi:hypothetical protein